MKDSDGASCAALKASKSDTLEKYAMYSKDQLNAIVGLFDLAITDYHELSYGSKWMGRRYVVTTDTGRFFLKVRSEWWPVAQAKYVCSIVKRLHSQGFTVPAMRLTATMEPFALWEGHICECHEFIEGQPFTPGSLDQIRAAGQTLSQLHLLSRVYSPPGDYLPEACGYPSPKRVQFFVDRIQTMFAGQAGAIGVLERVLNFLKVQDGEVVGQSHQNCAMVHGDYHPAKARSKNKLSIS
jgi:hypothetical protein